MKNLQIIVIALFLIVAIAFSVLFCYDLFMVDHVAPQIICDGEPLLLSVKSTDKELCSGLQAIDDKDGDITDRIIVRRVSQLVSSNAATVYYAVFDSASNYCTYTRTVTYTDYNKPRLKLSQPLSYNVNGVVTLEDRLTAYDVLDGDISSRIRIASHSVTNATVGEYPLSIYVTNSSGDTFSTVLTVIIQNITSQHPVIHLSEYLTYIPVNTEVDLEYFRKFIVSARESSIGNPVDPSEITITGELDTSRAGTYELEFSYTNSKDLVTKIILTVIVD